MTADLDARLVVILSEIPGNPCGAGLYAHDGGILIAPKDASPPGIIALPQVVEMAVFLLSIVSGNTGEGDDLELLAPDMTGAVRLEPQLYGLDIFLTFTRIHPDGELAILVDAKALASAVAHCLTYLSPKYALLSLSEDDLKVSARRRMATHD